MRAPPTLVFRAFRGWLLALSVSLVLVSPAMAADIEVDPAEQAAGSGDVTFSVQPAQRAGRDSRPFFAWGATPGATLRDYVAVVNYGKEPLRLTVYATDALNTDDGGFGLLPTAEEPVAAGAWMRLIGLRDDVRVPPRRGDVPGELVAPIEVTIPADASPGDHTGGIVAVLTSVDPNDEGTQVTLEQRVGTRAFIRVAGEPVPALAVDNIRASYLGTLNPLGRGSATVTYTLTNTGNINLGATSVVTVAGLLDEGVATPPDIPLLLPGSSVDVTVVVPDVLPQVWIDARVSVTPLLTNGDEETALPVVSASDGFWTVPWTLLALILVCLLAVTAWWLRRRRRRRLPGRHTSAVPPRQLTQGARS